MLSSGYRRRRRFQGGDNRRFERAAPIIQFNSRLTVPQTRRKLRRGGGVGRGVARYPEPELVGNLSFIFTYLPTNPCPLSHPCQVQHRMKHWTLKGPVSPFHGAIIFSERSWHTHTYTVKRAIKLNRGKLHGCIRDPLTRLLQSWVDDSVFLFSKARLIINRSFVSASIRLFRNDV